MIRRALVSVVALGLLIPGLPLRGPVPAEAAPSTVESAGFETAATNEWLLVVTANLAEAFDEKDMQSHTELRFFISRLRDSAPRRPDVLLLQEVRRSSARWVANRLNRSTRGNYVVVSKLDETPWRRTANGGWRETDTAIVVDKKRLAPLRQGFVQTADPWSHRFDMRKRQAWAAARHRETGRKLSFVSLHFAKSPNNRQEFPNRFERWSKKMGATLQTRFPDSVRVIGGDFNHTTDAVPNGLSPFGIERIAPAEKPFVVDYIYSSGAVGVGGRDSRQPPYSDHAFIWTTTSLTEGSGD